MKKLKAHLFICTSCTYPCADGKESDPSEAFALRKSLKTKARALYPKDEVLVSASGCLGKCEHGIAGVLYPEGKWFLGLRPDNEDFLLNEITDSAHRYK